MAGGGKCFQTGDGFDTANAGRYGAFTDQPEQTDFAGMAGVSATAQFHAPSVHLVWLAADLHDADMVAIFPAEELPDAAVGSGFGKWNFGP